MYIYNIQKNFVNIKGIKFYFTVFLHFYFNFAIFIIANTVFLLVTRHYAYRKGTYCTTQNIPESIPTQNIKSLLFIKKYLSPYYALKISVLPVLTKGREFDIIIIGEVFFYEKGLSKGA